MTNSIVLRSGFNAEISWLPELGQFFNMVVTAFWWLLAFIVAAIPVALVFFLILLLVSAFLSDEESESPTENPVKSVEVFRG